LNNPSINRGINPARGVSAPIQKQHSQSDEENGADDVSHSQSPLLGLNLLKYRHKPEPMAMFSRLKPQA
jgi:hypothetical protein